MSNTPPILTKYRMPQWKGLLAYFGIAFAVVLVIMVPPEKLLAFMGRPLFSSQDLGARSADISSAALWLVVANVSSLIAVWLLWRELRVVQEAAQGIHLKQPKPPSRSKYAVPDTVDDGNLTNYCLAPLGVVTAISQGVLLITLGISFALIVLGADLPLAVFNIAVVWTGFAYVLAMTISDLAARRSFRMLCSLELNLIGDTKTQEHMQQSHRKLLHTLADFDRMIFYVDVPVLIGVSIILLHKFFVLEPGPYYLGFVAGAVAMHTILANIISLTIAASETIPLPE